MGERDVTMGLNHYVSVPPNGLLSITLVTIDLIHIVLHFFYFWDFEIKGEGKSAICKHDPLNLCFCSVY